MTDSRPFVYPGPGKLDVEGVEWFACDPYPTWYRWENGELFIQYDRKFVTVYALASQPI